MSLVIWTTTPWTLPANVAITLHPDMDYMLLEHSGEYLIIGEPLMEQALEEMGITAISAKPSSREANWKG